MTSYNPKPVGCKGCPYEHIGLGYTPGAGPLNATTAFLGQGPGSNEAIFGQPFFDAPRRAGRKLTNWIDYGGPPLAPREGLWIDNACRCWIKTKSKTDEAPLRAIRECWRRHVGPVIHRLAKQCEEKGKQLHLVCVGTAASTFIVGPWARLGAAGSLFEVELPPLEVTSDDTTESPDDSPDSGDDSAVDDEPTGENDFTAPQNSNPGGAPCGDGD